MPSDLSAVQASANVIQATSEKPLSEAQISVARANAIATVHTQNTAENAVGSSTATHQTTSSSASTNSTISGINVTVGQKSAFESSDPASGINFRLDPSLGLVIIEFHNHAGDVTRSIPTSAELDAYKRWVNDPSGPNPLDPNMVTAAASTAAPNTTTDYTQANKNSVTIASPAIAPVAGISSASKTTV